MRGIRSRWLTLAGMMAVLLTVPGLAVAQDDESEASEAMGPLSGEITVWDLNYGFPTSEAYDAAADELDRQFMELHPDVTIDHVGKSLETYDQELQAAFTARSVPDVMKLVQGDRTLRWSDGLEDLTDRISPDKLENLSFWNAVSEGYDASTGAIYAVPVGTLTYVFYYNKPMFEQAGLDPDDPPSTYEELLDAVNALNEAGITPLNSGDKEGAENQWWFSLGMAAAGDPADTSALATGEASFDSEIVREALQAQKGLQDAGAYRDDRFSTGIAEGFEDFIAREGAMYLGLNSVALYYEVINDTFGNTDEAGVFLLPGLNYIPAESVAVWGLPKDAANKEAAWAYIDFATDEDANALLYEQGGIIPNDQRVEPLDSAPPQEKEILRLLNTLDLAPAAHSIIPQPALQEIANLTSEMLQGRMSIDDLLRSVEERVQ